MRKLLLYLLLSILLISCSAQRMTYVPGDALSDRELTAQIIEQILYEQPRRYRPESVFISSEFLGCADGVSSRTKSAVAGVGAGFGVVGFGSSRTLSKDINNRIYFNSISKPQIFTKRGWFIIQIRDKEGRLLRSVFTRDENKAGKFIDAILFFKNNAPEFGR